MTDMRAYPLACMRSPQILSINRGEIAVHRLGQVGSRINFEQLMAEVILSDIAYTASPEHISSRDWHGLRHRLPITQLLAYEGIGGV